jgi:hypothetical protein
MKRKLLLIVLMMIFISFLLSSEKPQKIETGKKEFSPEELKRLDDEYEKIVEQVIIKDNFPQSWNNVINAGDIILDGSTFGTYTKKGWQGLEYISQKESLKGIKSITVYVLVSGKEEVDKKVKDCGLKEYLIKTDVELKLRLAGIKVLSNEELLRKDSAVLTINVNLMESSTLSDFIFLIGVKLYQDTLLKRDIKKYLPSITWEYRYYGIVDISLIKEFIRNEIKDGIDEFINDYLEVNPKE